MENHLVLQAMELPFQNQVVSPTPFCSSIFLQTDDVDWSGQCAFPLSASPETTMVEFDTFPKVFHQDPTQSTTNLGSYNLSYPYQNIETSSLNMPQAHREIEDDQIKKSSRNTENRYPQLSDGDQAPLSIQSNSLLQNFLPPQQVHHSEGNGTSSSASASPSLSASLSGSLSASGSASISGEGTVSHEASVRAEPLSPISDGKEIVSKGGEKEKGTSSLKMDPKSRLEIRRARAARNRSSARRSRLKKKEESERDRKLAQQVQAKNIELKAHVQALREKFLSLQRIANAYGLVSVNGDGIQKWKFYVES